MFPTVFVAIAAVWENGYNRYVYHCNTYSMNLRWCWIWLLNLRGGSTLKCGVGWGLLCLALFYAFCVVSCCTEA